jgi:hypothetical protein
MGLFTPSPTINYNFVAGVYAFFSALFLLVLVLHFYTPQVEGFFVVLAPFVPCFLWSLVVRQRWLKEQAIVADEGKGGEGDEAESKKDK